MAGIIHDIGKLSVPAEILSKPTKLTDIEFALIKEHSRSGYEMLKDVESPWPLAEIVYQHHERMNGSGYPRNLKGDEILMESRILAVADVVEAMASHRPYRPTLGIEAALEEIEKNKGILYDNDCRRYLSEIISGEEVIFFRFNFGSTSARVYFGIPNFSIKSYKVGRLIPRSDAALVRLFSLRAMAFKMSSFSSISRASLSTMHSFLACS